MQTSFDLASAVRLLDAEGARTRFEAEIPDGWQQGRGAFGGLVLGTILRAVERAAADPHRRVRSLSGELAGPVAVGSVEIEVDSLRRGSNVSFYDARLRQGGEVLARASAVLGAARQVDVGVLPVAPPVVAPFETVPVAPVRPPIAPVFTQHYEFRVTGPAPFAGGQMPTAEGYVVDRGGRTRWDTPALVACADCFWPAIFATARAPRPTATVGFTAQIFVDPATMSAEPVFVRTRATGGGEGYVAETRELWQRGRLLALNHQTFVVIQ